MVVEMQMMKEMMDFMMNAMCRAFPIMLKGPARIWFNRLTPNFISTFKELSA